MKIASVLIAVLLTGCALSAKEIDEEIGDCEKYGLIPIVVVGGFNPYVKRVECTVPADEGYTIVERGLPLPSLPSLPSRP